MLQSENILVARTVEAVSWKEAMFKICDHPDWMHDQDIVGLRVRNVRSKKWHYPKLTDNPVEDN